MSAVWLIIKKHSEKCDSGIAFYDTDIDFLFSFCIFENFDFGWLVMMDCLIRFQLFFIYRLCRDVSCSTYNEAVNKHLKNST